MNENSQGDKPNNHLLGTHVWLLGTDVWQLSQKEAIQKLFPNHPTLTKLIQIAKILDKYQKEITYYQTRIRSLLVVIAEQKNHAHQRSPKKPRI